MKIRLYQVDAFTSRPFAGNPAAVCPLPGWLPDDRLREIARENNLSETAYLVPEGDAWRLRWFTPEVEVDLCGHATLASAYVLFERLEPGCREVVFRSVSGELRAERDGDRIALDFPSRPPGACPDVDRDRVVRALGASPVEILAARDLLAVFGRESDVARLRPEMGALAGLGRDAVCATAPSEAPGVDFVSRFFAPALGVPEDPVTGSAHATLVPYWSKRLGKPELRARQISARGGELFCRDEGDRVRIAGHAVLVLEGTLYLEPAPVTRATRNGP